MENLGWGLQMTVLGMGLVFSLLALLWVLLTLVLKFDKEESEADDTSEADESAAAEVVSEQSAPQAVAAGGTVSGELAVAIGLAVAKYKAQRMPPDLAAAITVAAIEHRKSVGAWRPAVARNYWPGTQPIRWTAEARERARQTNHWN